MPTFAVLGATGATGRQLTTILLDRPQATLHLYARSSQKLNALFPNLSTHPNVHTFISPLQDTENLVQCLSAADVIFSTESQNANEPGCSIVQENAQAIIKALEISRSRWRDSKKSTEWKKPKLILLSAMPLIPESQVPRPWPFYKMLYTALYYVYEDLRLASEYLKAEGAEKGLLDLVFACPGGLIDAEGKGWEIGLRKESPGTTYQDLAGAMVEMSEDEKWVGEYVAIEGKGEFGISDLAGNLWRFVLPGLVVSFLPWLYRPLRRVGFF